MVAGSRLKWTGFCLLNDAACGVAGLGGDLASKNASLIKLTGSTFHELEGMLDSVPGLVCSSEHAICSPSGVRATLPTLFREFRARLVELLGDTGCGSYLIGKTMLMLGALACQLVVTGCLWRACCQPDGTVD